jgi:hypothetical protein
VNVWIVSRLAVDVEGSREGRVCELVRLVAYSDVGRLLKPLKTPAALPDDQRNQILDYPVRSTGREIDDGMSVLEVEPSRLLLESLRRREELRTGRQFRTLTKDRG